MTVYLIRNDVVTSYASAPTKVSQDELLIGSAEELANSDLTNVELVAIWNAFPGNIPIKKFRDRQTAVQRLWAAFERLPVEPAAKPAGSGVRADSKQARVIDLLRRPEGATIDEMASAMGWQHHSVRGLIAGALKKKLGLEVVSEKTERGRLYRIAHQIEAGHAAA